jgi:hypothetical protein
VVELDVLGQRLAIEDADDEELRGAGEVAVGRVEVAAFVGEDAGFVEWLGAPENGVPLSAEGVVALGVNGELAADGHGGEVVCEVARGVLDLDDAHRGGVALAEAFLIDVDTAAGVGLKRRRSSPKRILKGTWPSCAETVGDMSSASSRLRRTGRDDLALHLEG